MVDFTVKVCQSDAIYFRDALRELEEGADQPALDQTRIGGVAFACAEYDDRGRHSLKYASRIPESNVTLLITVYLAHGVQFDVQPILDSITFNLPTCLPALTDPPQPQDGTPYHPQPGSVRIGDKEIKATWLPMDTPLSVEQTAPGKIACNGDTLYALSGRRVYAYSTRDGRLVTSTAFPDGVLKLDDSHSSLSVTRDGTLFVTNGFNKTFSVRDGAITQYNNSGGIGELAMHPCGEWGIYFHDHYAEMAHLNESGMTVEKWALPNLGDPEKQIGRFSGIRCVSICDDRIYVAGYDATRNDVMAVSVFDFDGRELFVAGSQDTSAPDRLSFVTDVVQTQNNVVLLDCNTLQVFSMDGTFLGAVNCNQLLGTHIAEIVSITLAEEGLYLSAAQTRDDWSCAELLIFHVTGL
jgi:hypothetical protein